MKIARPILAALVIIAAALVIYLPQVGFAVPHPSGLTLSNGLFVICNAIAFALFCVAFSFAVMRGRIKPKNMFKSAMWLFLASVGIAGVGEAACMIGGVSRTTVLLCCLGLMLAVTLAVYLLRRAKAARENSANSIRKSATSTGTARYCYNQLYAASLLSLVVAIAGLFVHGDNLAMLVPLGIVLVSIILWRLLRLRFFLLAGIAALMLQVFSSLYGLLAVASSGDSLGQAGCFLVIAYLDIMLSITLTDLYVRRDKAL